MLRKLLPAVLAVTSVAVIGLATPASAACPPAGCVVDVGLTTTYADLNTRIQVWMRIDYTNHRIRPYARFDTYNGVTLQRLATGPNNNTPRIGLWRGASQVLVTGTSYTGSTTTHTVAGSLYSCPTTPGDYRSSWSGLVDTSSYDYDITNLLSGLAQTTCGW